MTLVDSIAGKFGIKLVEKGSLGLIVFDDAAEFIRACEASDVGIIGIESFRVDGNGVVPDMSQIADFSAIESNSLSYREAWSFISKVEDKELFFDFCLRAC